MLSYASSKSIIEIYAYFIQLFLTLPNYPYFLSYNPPLPFLLLKLIRRMSEGFASLVYNFVSFVRNIDLRYLSTFPFFVFGYAFRNVEKFANKLSTPSKEEENTRRNWEQEKLRLNFSSVDRKAEGEETARVVTRNKCNTVEEGHTRGRDGMEEGKRAYKCVSVTE